MNIAQKKLYNAILLFTCFVIVITTGLLMFFGVRELLGFKVFKIHFVSAMGLLIMVVLHMMSHIPFFKNIKKQKFKHRSFILFFIVFLIVLFVIAYFIQF